MELTSAHIRQQREAFWERIKADLSIAEFEQLQHELGYSKYKWTSVQNGTSDFRESDLEVVSQYTHIDRMDLIQKYCLLMNRLSVAAYCRTIEEDVAA